MGHCSVESSPGITTLNGAPLPVGGVAAEDGLPTRIVATSATTDKEGEFFKGRPGSLGKAKPKVTWGQLEIGFLKHCLQAFT